MNILYLSPGQGADYQSDMLFHGLRTLYGPSVVDHQPMSHMYSDYPSIPLLYGRGFTLYGLLPPIEVDRTNLPRKITNHFFDLIIYASIQRYQPFLDYVTEHYQPHEVIFVDGEDQQQGLYNLTRWGLYFKRELRSPHPGVYPIHFAIPASKVQSLGKIPKDRVRAFIDPRDRSTYIYSCERDYYTDYARSLFAFTCMKGGWDSLRHLEIMANKCIPLFLDLDQCPELTAIHLPKPELLEALAMQDRDGSYWGTEEGHFVWLSLWRRIHLKFSLRSTTERLAEYVLGVAQRAAYEARAAQEVQ